MKHIESRLQIACVRWFRMAYPQYKLMLFSVPNGGKRTLMEAIIMKNEGVVSGVSDLILLVGRKGFNSLCIEMKNKTSQTINQKCWQLEAERNGNKYVVCKSFDEFRMAIEDYLK